MIKTDVQGGWIKQALEKEEGWKEKQGDGESRRKGIRGEGGREKDR